MKVRLRFFASLRERLPAGEREIDVPEGITVRQIWGVLCSEQPALERLGASVSFAVNREYVDADTAVCDGDEVAFIPPVSGG